ncbi:MAG TPA: helix-turn-helix transcriptional regulator [Stellaceae bacterium]|nr:helix-turn-helix transcriptional regulator [Stellaceae bacterium]
MPETARRVSPLNWPALVAEALRRRRQEKLTQRAHAELAGVSIPTMIAFERAHHTLSLAKAMDILRVVGLVEEISAESLQDIFVRDATARWRELTRDLPKESPARFPAGWFRVDYALEGDIKSVSLQQFGRILHEAIEPHTGWPMFQIPAGPEPGAYEIDDIIECWRKPDDFGGALSDAAHSDFWRAAPSGRLMLMRGYQEDGQETFPPGTIFDTTLPLWRMGEAFLHAARLSALLAPRPRETKVHLRFLYTGLTGRDLRAWALPQSVDQWRGNRSRSDEVLLEATTLASDIAPNLAHHLHPLVASLFERFGVAGLSQSFVESELERMRKSRPGGVPGGPKNRVPQN